MCRRRPSDSLAAPGKKDDASAGATPGFRVALRIPLPVLAALLPFLPASCYLNRGYTVWFHLLSLACLLSRSRFLRKFLVVQGVGICLGWYAVLFRDWLADGTFCHMLYRNMPGSMIPYMLEERPHDVGGYSMLDDPQSYALRAVSNVLDLIAHPVLVYLFWRLHRRSGGGWRDVLDWPPIVAAWHCSRAWSLVHSCYNAGAPALWYVGHDVYKLSSLDVWPVAYILEGAWFAAAIGLRLFWDYRDRGSRVKGRVDQDCHYDISVNGDDMDSKPMLVHSESAFSTSSLG
ncbi:hypothetical protein ACHAWF_000921 [Thalassiosira exigua]